MTIQQKFLEIAAYARRTGTLKLTSLRKCSDKSIPLGNYIELFLTDLHNVHTLDLNNTSLDADTSFGLGEVLVRCGSNLLNINLANCDLGDYGAAIVAGALPKLPNLKTLVLSYNRIREDGAKFLVKALESGHSLRELDIRFNEIGSEAACRLHRINWMYRQMRPIQIYAKNVPENLLNMFSVIDQKRSKEMFFGNQEKAKSATEQNRQNIFKQLRDLEDIIRHIFSYIFPDADKLIIKKSNETSANSSNCVRKKLRRYNNG